MEDHNDDDPSSTTLLEQDTPIQPSPQQQQQQLQHQHPAEPPTLACSSCHQSYPRDHYSKRQRKRPNSARRCPSCCCGAGASLQSPPIDKQPPPDEERTETAVSTTNNTNNHDPDTHQEPQPQPREHTPKANGKVNPKRKRPTLYDDDDDDNSALGPNNNDNDKEEEEDGTPASVSVEQLKHRILGRRLVTSSSPPQSTQTQTQSQTKLSLDDVRREWTCAICHELLYEPTSLHPCGHSFCQACLQWWFHHSASPSQPSHQPSNRSGGTCPTCRHAIPVTTHCAVNRALRTGLEYWFPEECQARRRAHSNTTTTQGEHGGAHDRGYQVLVEINDSQAEMVRGRTQKHAAITVQRNVVLDAQDQCRQLQLALYANASGSSGVVTVEGTTLHVTIGLLSMEEDEVEAEQGFPLVVLEDSENEHLLAQHDDRFCAAVDVTAMVLPLAPSASLPHTQYIPLARRFLGRDGWVAFELDVAARRVLDPVARAGTTTSASGTTSQHVTFCFVHEETGAALHLHVPTSLLFTTTATQPRSLDSAAAMDASDDDDDDVERDTRHSRKRQNKHYSLVHDQDDAAADAEEDDDSDLDRFEDDGFIVGDDDENEEDNHDDDEDMCVVCGDGGELMACDGGEHVGGCGRYVHAPCVLRQCIPQGDWICQDCAHAFGLPDVGKEGYEFLAAAAAAVDKGQDSSENELEDGAEFSSEAEEKLIDLEDSSSSDDDEGHKAKKSKRKVVAAASRKIPAKKRPRILDSSSESEHEDDHDNENDE